MAAFPWIEASAARSSPTASDWRRSRYGPPPGIGADDRHAARGARLRRAVARLSRAKLAAGTGWGVLAYSRAGYGQSDPVDLPRPLDYMTREARSSLPAVLEAIGFERGILLATATAPRSRRSTRATDRTDRVDGLVLIAPHVFTEAPGLASIAEARRAYGPATCARGSPNITPSRHRVLRLERRVARSGVQGLEHRGYSRPLARPRASDPGRGRPIWNAGANPRDRSAIAGARREPDPRRLPPFAADRAAAGDAGRRS